MGFDPVVWFMNTVFTIPLVLGAELKCSCGSKHRYLLLETDNIEINGIPKACVDDCEAFNNIRPFGTCSDGSACKDCMELEGEWENPEPQTELINGREIITTDSFLMCKAKGGTIEAVTSGQEHGFSFQRVLALFEEMEEKYPGLFDQLIDTHGSLYLEEGMYEKAIQFLEDYLGERNGEVLLALIYDMKEPKDLFVVAVLDRLLTDCDGSRYDRIINGLENTGAQTGMDQKEGWDIHKLNQQMVEMLKIDCKATSEKINTSSFARWTEEHKKFVNILGKTTEFVSNTAVLLYCSAASAATRAARSEGNLGPGTLSNVDARKWYLEQEAKIPDLIDDSLPLEQQARQAFELRNQYRMQARELMSDRQLAESLYATDPNLTWEQIIQKQIDKGLSGDDIYKAIIESSQRSRTSVNQVLGLE